MCVRACVTEFVILVHGSCVVVPWKSVSKALWGSSFYQMILQGVLVRHPLVILLHIPTVRTGRWGSSCLISHSRGWQNGAKWGRICHSRGWQDGCRQQNPAMSLSTRTRSPNISLSLYTSPLLSQSRSRDSAQDLPHLHYLLSKTAINTKLRLTYYNTPRCQCNNTLHQQVLLSNRACFHRFCRQHYNLLLLTTLSPHPPCFVSPVDTSSWE